MNYGFLQLPVPGSPLMLIADIFGTGRGYLVGYMLGYVFLMLLLYGVYYVVRAAARGRK